MKLTGIELKRQMQISEILYLFCEYDFLSGPVFSQPIGICLSKKRFLETGLVSLNLSDAKESVTIGRERKTTFPGLAITSYFFAGWKSGQSGSKITRQKAGNKMFPRLHLLT